MRSNKITLPNGWSLTPAGKTILLNHDLPLNMVVSPNKKQMAITNKWQSNQGKTDLDLATETILKD